MDWQTVDDIEERKRVLSSRIGAIGSGPHSIRPIYPPTKEMEEFATDSIPFPPLDSQQDHNTAWLSQRHHDAPSKPSETYRMMNLVAGLVINSWSEVVSVELPKLDGIVPSRPSHGVSFEHARGRTGVLEDDDSQLIRATVMHSLSLVLLVLVLELIPRVEGCSGIC